VVRLEGQQLKFQGFGEGIRFHWSIAMFLR